MDDIPNVLPSPAVAMSSSTSQFIEHYFRALAEHGVPAVIIHGYEHLPEQWDSDIDYVVPREALKKVPAICAEVAKKHGWSAAPPISANLRAICQVVFRLDRPEESLQLDACSDYVHSRCFIATAEELMAGAKERRLFLTSAPAVEFAYHLGKNFAKRRPIARVLPRLLELVAQDASGCEAAFRRLLGTENGPLSEWLPRDAEKWEKLAPILRRRRRFGPWLMLQESLRLLRRWWSPSGLRLVVLGPDGAGKSTLIAALSRLLGPCFRAVDYIHSRPGVLDAKPDGGVVSEPHAKIPRSWPACMAKIFYYAFDHWLGWLIRVRPATVRNRLVIYDRDFYDVIVDPTRYRLRGVGALARVLVRLLPQADFTLVLDAPPEIIHARKPELPVAELARQRNVLRHLAAERESWHLLDASQNSEAVAHEAISTVLKHINFQP